MQTVEKSHHLGVARHISDPLSSAFRVVDYVQYKNLSDKEIGGILERQSIVVKNMDWENMEFNEEGLSSLGALHWPVSIQGVHPSFSLNQPNLTSIDLSLPQPSENLSERLVQGNLLQMLESSRAGSRSKALNGLAFPFETTNDETARFATCRTAWKHTSRMISQRTGTSKFPTSDVHWGLAATEGAVDFWHIDSDGFGTTIDVRTGEKIWIVGRGDPEDYAELGLLLSDSFDIDKPPQNFETEAIFLTQNTRL